MSISKNKVFEISNLQLAFIRLITNEENTYKDFFRPIYTGYNLALQENLKNLSKKIRNGYLPETNSIHVFQPKNDGLHRMYTLLPVEDQIVYQAFANVVAEALVPKIRKRYYSSIFGNIYTKSGCEYFYESWKKSYKKYTKAVTRSYSEGNSFIATFDLTAFYDSIDHELLKNCLLKVGIDELCANEFVELLAIWQSSNNTPRIRSGIPQGPLSSGIISELILNELDLCVEKEKKKYSFSYFRYVDDIKVMAKDERTVRQVLFVIEKRCKELGLFPQSSKISVHRINNIDDEIKNISLPSSVMYDFSEKQDQHLIDKIKQLRKSYSKNSSLIRLMFQDVQPCAKNNPIAISFFKQHPDFLYSFSYYLSRYPRTIPVSLMNVIWECCNKDQFSAGLLLDKVKNKLAAKDEEKLYRFASKQLRKKCLPDITDCRYYEQLLLICIKYESKRGETISKRIKLIPNWWIHAILLSDLGAEDISSDNKHFIYFPDNNSDLDSAVVSGNVLLNHYEWVSSSGSLPANKVMHGYLQNILKESGVINRVITENSQINGYLSNIVSRKLPFFSWKTKIRKAEKKLSFYMSTNPNYSANNNLFNKFEQDCFRAQSYWRTDINAFVNLWDSIDDQLLTIIEFNNHPELGTPHQIGNIGALNTDKIKTQHIPKVMKMIQEIHKYRYCSYLSHPVNIKTQKMTRQIPAKERNRIKKLILSGMIEFINYC